MDKLLEVKEFDTITGNADYQDVYRYLPSEAFKGLMDFIHEYTADDEKTDVLEFLRIGYKRNVGDVVSIKNYVGLIQLQNGWQLQILPKIHLVAGEDPGNTRTKRTFLKMLRSMKDFPGKMFADAALQVDRMNLYEIFINLYLQNVRQLVKRGIKSDYVPQEENLRVFRGKLLLKQHIRTNMVHKEQFYVSFDEYHPNRAENRLIKATLLKLRKLSASAENAKEIRQLLTAFEPVEASVNFQKDFAAVKTDRHMKDYEMLMQWSKVFLLNKSFTTFSGQAGSRALLFPMESLYESYVAQQMKKVMGPDGWTVTAQHRGHYLFEEPRKQFSLRPDIVLERDGRRIVMDTKWKHLIDDERKNYGISQADMYQMYAYSKKYEASEIWVLYPQNEEMARYDDIRFNSGDGTMVHVFFLDVASIEESLTDLLERIN